MPQTPIPEEDPSSIDFRADTSLWRAELSRLCVIAVAVGLVAGGVVVAFRSLIDAGSSLPRGMDSAMFEWMDIPVYSWMPLLGALILVAAFGWLKPRERQVGITHLLERLANHGGTMPLRNVGVQFVGAIVALPAGFSGGREGPAIHLGAATASYLGRFLRLGNHYPDTLCACGIAAAVASSFNTPVAGVILAVELIGLRYRLDGFLPVILAAAVATALSRLLLGDHPVFVIPVVDSVALMELPYILACGALIGVAATAFKKLITVFANWSRERFALSILFAGVTTSAVSLIYPEIMGMSYGTVSDLLHGDLGWAIAAVAGFIVAKILCTCVAIGAGVPLGRIGPSIVIGAGLGYLAWLVAPLPQVSAPALYVLTGMTAMMAAVIRTPLAAVLSVVEMSTQTAPIFPATLAIAAAVLTDSVLTRGETALYARFARTKPMGNGFTGTSATRLPHPAAESGAKQGIPQSKEHP